MNMLYVDHSLPECLKNIYKYFQFFFSSTYVFVSVFLCITNSYFTESLTRIYEKMFPYVSKNDQNSCVFCSGGHFDVTINFSEVDIN